MTVDTDIDEISTDARDNPHFRAPQVPRPEGYLFYCGLLRDIDGSAACRQHYLNKAFCPGTLRAHDLVDDDHCGFESLLPYRIPRQRHSNISRGDDESFINTAWTIQALRGVGLWLVMVIVAWPVAHFYDQRLLWLLPFVGFGAIISGFRSPNLLSLSRHLGVARLSLLDLICQLTQYIVAIGWAFFDRSIRALVVAGLVSELVRTLLSYRIVRGGVRPRFVLEREALRSILTFGRWILIGTALTFLANQSDRLILPKLLPKSNAFQVLGVYGIAFALSDLPRQIISMFSSNVGFPFIAKFAHLPRPDFRKLILKYRRMVTG